MWWNPISKPPSTIRSGGDNRFCNTASFRRLPSLHPYPVSPKGLSGYLFLVAMLEIWICPAADLAPNHSLFGSIAPYRSNRPPFAIHEFILLRTVVVPFLKPGSGALPSPDFRQSNGYSGKFKIKPIFISLRIRNCYGMVCSDTIRGKTTICIHNDVPPINKESCNR